MYKLSPVHLSTQKNALIASKQTNDFLNELYKNLTNKNNTILEWSQALDELIKEQYKIIIKQMEPKISLNFLTCFEPEQKINH